MKRAGDLFERILERDNLRLAFRKALRGKRARPDARAFAARLDEELRVMAADLAQGTVSLGRFRQFTIFDPKERLITAPCFRERVLHHAVMNLCEPVLEQFLIDDTFACRRGKGRLVALDRARRFAQHHGFFLKLDIRKYFDSIPHENLLARLERRFKDRRLLDLFRRIVAAYACSPGRGLPIGSLTSQHLANFYLGWLDRWVKERLRVRGYVRYMDDFVLWADAAAPLRDWREQVREFLAEELDLRLKLEPILNRTAHGMDFLGCRVYRDRCTLTRGSRRRFHRKLARLEAEFLAGRLDEQGLQQRATALVAFTRTPGLTSLSFRRRTLQCLEVSGHKAPSG